MIIVTGGAGFIGSVLVWYLNQQGRTDIIVVDHLGRSDKWKNLVGLRFAGYFDRADFITRLEAGQFDDAAETVYHLGACSSTTEQDTGYLMENNYRYSMRIGEWWNRHPGVRLVYASSAATYGDGAQGYADDEQSLDSLRPLNMYGYSKHLFDLHARQRGWLSRIVGIKYFNVFGPNEGHKGDMRSLISKAYPVVRDGGAMTLFRSGRSGYADGEQRRDFIYVKDAAAMTLFFGENRAVAGLYNVGTGTARSWNDVASALFAAAGRPRAVTYVPMPDAIAGKYQYFTQADLGKIRNTGCGHRCMTLEEAVGDYVSGYLSKGCTIAGAC